MLIVKEIVIKLFLASPVSLFTFTIALSVLLKVQIKKKVIYTLAYNVSIIAPSEKLKTT